MSSFPERSVLLSQLGCGLCVQKCFKGVFRFSFSIKFRGLVVC